MLSVVAVARRFFHSNGPAKTYLTGGIVFGITSQDSASVLEVVTQDGELVSTGRVAWGGQNSDWGVGATIGLGWAMPLGDAVEGFGEIGYRALLTPDDSVPDNPDYMTGLIGLRFRL